MNDYCCNQNQGLKARQHTSTHLFHWVSCHKLSTTFPTPSPPHPPAPGGCISHEQKNETWLLVVVQFYPRLPYLFDYKPSDFCTKLNWKLVKSLQDRGFGLYLPWEQWFLHARCYATKREKLLPATVNFSTEHACPSDVTSKCQDTSSCFAWNIRNLNIQRPDGKETVNKTNRFNKQNNNLHVQHNVLCIPMLFLHNYDVKMHNFVFYR